MQRYIEPLETLLPTTADSWYHALQKHITVADVFDRYDVKNISQNQSTSEHNFWIDMTGYDFTRFVFQGCFGIHVFMKVKKSAESLLTVLSL
jgi:hypothetical protein